MGWTLPSTAWGGARYLPSLIALLVLLLVLYPQTKVSFTKPKQSWGFVNKTFVWGHKTSYWAITLYYQIVSLFDMIIDMGERIAGKQNRPSLIIEPPHTHTKNIHFVTFWLVYEKLVVNCFPLLHRSQLWRGLHLPTFWYPWMLCKGPWPRKNGKKIFHVLDFISKGFYQIASIYTM